MCLWACGQLQLQVHQDASGWYQQPQVLMAHPVFLCSCVVLCPFVANKLRRRMEFCNFFGISKLLFLLLQLASVAPTFHLPLSSISIPSPRWNIHLLLPLCFLPLCSLLRIVGLRFFWGQGRTMPDSRKEREQQKNRSRKMTFVGFRNFHCTRNWNFQIPACIFPCVGQLLLSPCPLVTIPFPSFPAYTHFYQQGGSKSGIYVMIKENIAAHAFSIVLVPSLESLSWCILLVLSQELLLLRFIMLSLFVEIVLIFELSSFGQNNAQSVLINWWQFKRLKRRRS